MKKKFTILLFTIATCLLTLSPIVSANSLVNGNEQSSDSGIITPYSEPCPYWSGLGSTSHRFNLSDSSQERSVPTGPAQTVIIVNPNGSITTVECQMYNVYTVNRYVCACGKTQDQLGNVKRIDHSVSQSHSH